MKRNALSLIILILPLFLCAQNWEVDFGEPYKKRHKTGWGGDAESSRFLGLDKQHYFLNHKSKRENEILQFDFEHNLVNVFPIGENFKGKEFEAENILKMNKRKYLISSYLNRKKKYIYATRLNNDGSLGEVKEPLFSYLPSRSNSGSLNTDARGFSISPDSSKIVFAMVGDYESRSYEGNEVYQIFVFDNQLNKLWEKEVLLPNLDKKIQVHEFRVNDIGDVILVAKHKFKRNNSCIPKGDFFILRVKEEAENILNTLRLKNSYPISITTFFDNDILYVAGIYTDGMKERSGADGTFMMKFDDDDELSFYKKYPFEEKIKKYLIPNRQKRGSENFFNFEIDDLLIDYRNGYFLFVAENRYVANIGVIYTAEDIIVSKFTFEGKLEWNFHKDKKSFGSSAIYGLSHGNGNIYLIYNARKTTKERKQIQHKRRPNWSSTYTDVIKINDKGKIEFEETIFHSRELKIPISPRFSRKINSKNILLFFHDQSNFRYGTLKFR
ncbi:MAG: hypothetical protein AB8H03_05850 [Saprospiraceae bacterium]